MKRFNITVNGTAYDVAVEELAAGAAPVAAPAPAPAPYTPLDVYTSNLPLRNIGILIPVPYTHLDVYKRHILDIKVAAGDAVKKGDVLAILEAMKMENEIMCPQDGTVASINVQKGDSVNSNDLIMTLQ
ncbi:acetyl-CoA carboxylase biotin carboxyl carrier protein subunit [Bittarella massiliensis (ex Durand et al. 2017)]|uniref:acetyl-CoA carboxylase biotin carboxyl carrier protein subunit n=1 Tax=Bittarella massiliensis (ex Durand et al. 2017) TaxID=1720313 RepID=UPI00073F71CB|nr:acetyl-CoA carboxylase biotin carboxyl carrier protein subunit [Bittarella massiliensis (ex Durand et al. 2017)]